MAVPKAHQVPFHNAAGTGADIKAPKAIIMAATISTMAPTPRQKPADFLACSWAFFLSSVEGFLDGFRFLAIMKDYILSITYRVMLYKL